MPRDDTARVIAEIVERVSGGPAARLSPESTFVDDLGIDSLTMMEIVVAVEDQFGVRVNDDDVEGLRSIRDAADYIERARVGLTGASGPPG
jgi:acyl carrier protein